MDTGTKTHVQGGNCNDYHGRNGNLRLMDPIPFLTFIYERVLWQFDRLEEMSLDPTGRGSPNSVGTYFLIANLDPGWELNKCEKSREANPETPFGTRRMMMEHARKVGGTHLKCLHSSSKV